MRILKYSLVVFFPVFVFAAGTSLTKAATITVSPTSGTFSVGSTYNVSIFLDTEGQDVNVVDIGLRFPPDKIQVISPSTGQSIIGVWTSPPRFSNQTGEIKLQGGIPGGINVSRGLITTLTFRVKQVGTATLRFDDASRILLNDGKGTDALGDTQGGIYTLILPPPAGPLVVSETHPDQSVWYPSSNVIFQWAGDPDVQGYSYAVSDNPVDPPDDISEGTNTGVTYSNLSDGVHYFHIKALRDNSWGGITHFAFNIDTAPPAAFPIEVSPRKRTVRTTPVISWGTTDVHSGIEHYEIKLISLSNPDSAKADSSEAQSFFIETMSPYTPTLQLGKYDVVVRAYDKAGNYREVKERIEIVKALFDFIAGEGIRISSRVTISWTWVALIGVILVGILSLAGQRVWRWRRRVEERVSLGALKDPVIRTRLAELKKRQARHAKSLAVLLFLIGISWQFTIVYAQESKLSPPLVTLVSENITNEELFYVGGKSQIPGSEVVIYLQNTQTGETFDLKAPVDKAGNWFYSHSQFLPTGEYLLWTQSKVGDNLSVPSPQFKMDVAQTAVQFGASRISYETLYLIFAIILLIIVLGLLAFIGFHAYHGRKKNLRFHKEIKEVNEALKMGFAVLRRDIERELGLINQAKPGRKLAAEEKRKEQELIADLEWVEKEIGKELLDVERL